MSRIVSSFDRLLFPTGYRCLICGAETVLPDDGICEDCRASVSRCPSPVCPSELDGLWVSYLYESVIREAMHRFKYSGCVWLAPLLVRYIALPDDFAPDAVVPVPMHPFKQWRRRYNPPEALAEALRLRYPSLPEARPYLKKTRRTVSQTRLSKEERAENAKNRYFAAQQLNGLSVLLVDDVTTTGSTLNACASALRLAGASKVYAACACFAPKDSV